MSKGADASHHFSFSGMRTPNPFSQLRSMEIRWAQLIGCDRLQPNPVAREHRRCFRLEADEVHTRGAPPRRGWRNWLCGTDVPKCLPAGALPAQARPAAAAPHARAASAIDVGEEIFVRSVLVVVEIQVRPPTARIDVPRSVLHGEVMNITRAHVKTRDQIILGAF